MSERQPAQAGAVPLLLELARARRAREFYPLDHPTVSDAVRRLSRVWRAALASGGELELRLERDGFHLLGVSALRGPGIDDLAIELQARGLRRLRVGAAFLDSEMAALVDALGASRSGPGELERTLEAAGVRYVTTTELSWNELAERQRLLAPAEAATERAPEPEERAEGDDTATTAVQTPSPEVAAPRASESDRAEERDEEKEEEGDLVDAAELLRLLGELESCEELAAYRRLAGRIEQRCDALVRDQSFFDAYRAALAYSRHTEGPGEELAGIRDEARSRLARLLDSRPFLEFVMGLASSGEGLTCVQATRVLVGAGEAIVPELLDLHVGEDPAQSQLAASILIAMGDAALGGIVEALGSPTLERARRAAELLGALQHPRAVQALQQALRDSPHPGIRPRIARALLHIGSGEALDVLIAALDAGGDLGELAAHCLGESRDARALAALIATVEQGRGRTEAVRREAIRSLGRLGGERALAALRGLLEQRPLLHRKRVRPLRIAAAQALAHIGGEPAREALEAHAHQGDTAVRRACKSALERLDDATAQDTRA